MPFRRRRASRTNDLDGTSRMTGHGFRHAAHQEPAQTLPSMRTKDDQVRAPIRCVVKDPRFRVTLFHDFTCFEARFPEMSGCGFHKYFGFFSSLLFHFRDVRHKVRNHAGREINANWLDYMQYPNLRPCGAELFGNCLYSRLRESGIIDCQKDFHRFWFAPDMPNSFPCKAAFLSLTANNITTGLERSKLPALFEDRRDTRSSQ